MEHVCCSLFVPKVSWLFLSRDSLGGNFYQALRATVQPSQKAPARASRRPGGQSLYVRTVENLSTSFFFFFIFFIFLLFFILFLFLYYPLFVTLSVLYRFSFTLLLPFHFFITSRKIALIVYYQLTDLINNKIFEQHIPL